MFQLCARDEYGSVSIIARKEDIDELITEAKKKVTNDNMSNPLTADEQMKDWESCWILFIDENDEVIDNAVYAGKTSSNKDRLYLMTDEGAEEHLLIDVEVGLRFYIGTFVKDHRKGISNDLIAMKPSRKNPRSTEPISDLKDQLMEDKTFYYIIQLK